MGMLIEVRPLGERDLPEADRIFRLAFGTFIGLPDPMSFIGDAELVGPRWRAAPEAALGAYVDGALVGSNFAANWGSFGFFGPLTVRPDFWGQGVAGKLLAATMDLFESWGTRHVALFTFASSPMHIGLYRKFGFQPRSLTPVLSKPVGRGVRAAQWSAFSEVQPDARARCLDACRALTGAVHPGLDAQGEIRSVMQQRLGDTVLVHDGAELAAFAVCHLGKGSEAGSGAAYIKFRAARPGAGAAHRFERLLSACEAFAAARGAERLVAGVNVARRDAHRMMSERGFETFLEGIAMHRPDEPGYSRPECFVVDDLR
jgi:GNAT superfamily N-acetyltransferase